MCRVEEHGANGFELEGGRLEGEEEQHRQENATAEEVERTDVEGTEGAQSGHEDGAHGDQGGRRLAVPGTKLLAHLNVLGEDGQCGDEHRQVGHYQRPSNCSVVPVNCCLLQATQTAQRFFLTACIGCHGQA